MTARDFAFSEFVIAILASIVSQNLESRGRTTHGSMQLLPLDMMKLVEAINILKMKYIVLQLL